MLCIVKITSEAKYRFAESEKEAGAIVRNAAKEAGKNPEMISEIATGHELKYFLVASPEESYRIVDSHHNSEPGFARAWTPICSDYDRVAAIACR